MGPAHTTRKTYNTDNETVLSVYAFRKLGQLSRENTLKKNMQLKKNNKNGYYNYSDNYNFPSNTPSVSYMINSLPSTGTNLGTIPF